MGRIKGPAAAARQAAAAGWRFKVQELGGPVVGVEVDSLAAACDALEAAALADVLSGNVRQLRVYSCGTGRYLDDWDAPNGRHYLTARTAEGAAIRSVRYRVEGELDADTGPSPHTREEALHTAAWAMSDFRLTGSDFDPRKAWGA